MVSEKVGGHHGSDLLRRLENSPSPSAASTWGGSGCLGDGGGRRWGRVGHRVMGMLSLPRRSLLGRSERAEMPVQSPLALCLSTLLNPLSEKLNCLGKKIKQDSLTN